MNSGLYLVRSIAIAFLLVLAFVSGGFVAVHADEPIAEVCDSYSDEFELRRFKQQPLQSLSAEMGYVADTGDDGLSSGYADLAIGSGIPLGSFENILGVKPRVRIDWIEAVRTIDIPDQLYQFEVQFFYRRPIHDRLSAMAIVAPAVRSDLTTSDEAFRVFALGLLNWECIPDRLTLSGGAVYLGRADLPVVPAIGARWTPDRYTRLDLQFPTSKFSRRLAKDGRQSETWGYVSGGLGGNTWAVTRDSGVTDELSLRDFRITSGVEKTVDGGGGWFVEVGYAMARKIEFERADEEIDLNDAVLVRASWIY